MPLLLRKRGSSGTFWPNYDFIPCTNADELFSLDPRRYSLAGLIACQNNISLLANFGTLPTSPCCLQTLQECQCQKFHRIHFGCRYQIQNCIACLKTLLLLLFGAVLQAKNTLTRFGSESVARGKLFVLTCKHSNHFKPNTTLDP